ncbi:MAG TPA: hypothetical protein VLL95_06710, partial [Phnomibacter sp.]|nr:hypothetical protein [Phnomibacter sp.]
MTVAMVCPPFRLSSLDIIRAGFNEHIALYLLHLDLYLNTVKYCGVRVFAAILIIVSLAQPGKLNAQSTTGHELRVDFFGDTLSFEADESVRIPFPANALNKELITDFYHQMD